MEGVAPIRPDVPRSLSEKNAPIRAEPSDPEDAPRARPHPSSGGGSTGRATVSWRVVVLVLVLVMALAVILPSLRAYIRQRDRLAELRAEAADARAEVAELEAELARWDDPSYIAAQARERLSYVFPGETPYRVVDPETVTGTPLPEAQPDSPSIRDGVPWYAVVWESIEDPEGS